MHLTPLFKRIGLSIGITCAMLTLCLFAYNAHSNCGTAARADSLDAKPRRAGAVPHTGHHEYAMPWFKIVVTRAISIANYLAA